MPRRPSILILAPYLSRAHAGAAHATISIANALHRRGKVRVVVAAYEIGPEALDDDVETVVLSHPAPHRFLWRVDRALRTREMAAALSRAGFPRAGDELALVYTQSMECGLAWRRLDGTTPVMAHPGHVLVDREVREESDRTPLWRSLDARIAERIERATHRSAGWTHVVSNRLVSEARTEHYGLPPGFFAVQPLGIDLARFSVRQGREDARSRLGVAAGDCVIACVARMVAWKNLDWLIAVFPELPSHCRLLLIGDGPERPRLETKVPAGLRDRVHFTGHVDPAPWLSAADVFALPSQIESFGVAYAEAMSMGLPCVGLRYAPPERLSSAADVIGDGVGGLIVDDVAGLQRALTTLALDGKLRHRLGEGAAHRARTLFSEQAYAEFVEQRIVAPSSPDAQPSPAERSVGR